MIILHSALQKEKGAEPAFENSENLRRVTLLEGVERIGAFAFAWDASLEEVTLPGSIQKIASNAFFQTQIKLYSILWKAAMLKHLFAPNNREAQNRSSLSGQCSKTNT